MKCKLSHNLVFCICTGFLLGSLISTCFAQSEAQNGQIEGTITDPNGAAVSKASVSSRNVETGTTRSAATGESGVYRFPLLPLGTYRITVQAPNFKRFVRDGITLAAGQAATVDIPLEPGSVEETVIVSGDASVADSGKTEIGRVMNTREVQNIPLIARNPYQ